MQSNFMDFEFGKLHYSTSISGHKNTIIFLHAFHSSAAASSKICNLLKDKFNLICLDFQGHGLSPHLDMNQYSHYYGFAGAAKVLIEFLNNLKNLKLENIILVGDSLGGNTMARALPHLKNIKGLVFIASIQAENKDIAFKIMFPEAPLDLMFKKDLNTQEIEKLAQAYACKELELMAVDITNTDPNFREHFPRNIESEEWVDEVKMLKNNPLPLLYILGKQDGFVNAVFYKKILLERGLAESQIKLLDQAGHVCHLDQPEICAQLISEFANKI